MLRKFKKNYNKNALPIDKDIIEIVNNSNGHLIMQQNVISVPVTNSNLPGYDFEGGLMDAFSFEPVVEAQLIRYTNIVQTITENKKENGDIPNTNTLKNTTYYYGGILFNNFGHFLLESLSRLWGLQEKALQPLPIVFHAPWGVPEYKNKKHYMYQAFKALSIPLEQIIILNETSYLRNVIIPKQKYGFGLCRNPDKFFKSFIETFKLPKNSNNKANNLKKIYISRSKLPFNQGRPFGEQLFEEYLKTQGYHIIHPEKYSLYEQLHLYKNAEKIIFCDGGAMYSNVLLPQLKADVAIIARRRDPRWNYKEITDHFMGYNKNILWIDEVTCQYQFGLETWDAAAEIDWNKVSEELVITGFCTDKFSINTPVYTEIKQIELQGYIKAIHTNPIFITYMEKLKEQHPLVPASF